jgi:tRNA threonylcarbamoyladenosine modification (KEOPS) complex  Pcc1 subunit
MEVSVLDPKRAQMIELLREWTTRATSNLNDISSLRASLESLTRYIKWAQANPS